jgi:hypothetical protein
MNRRDLEHIQYLKKTTYQEIDDTINYFQGKTNSSDEELSRIKEEFRNGQRGSLKKRFYFLINIAIQDIIKRDGETVDFGDGKGACRCGEDIRYGYPVKSTDGLSTILGSICVQTLGKLNDKWIEQLTSFKEMKSKWEVGLKEYQNYRKEKQRKENPLLNFADFLYYGFATAILDPWRKKNGTGKY